MRISKGYLQGRIKSPENMFNVIIVYDIAGSFFSESWQSMSVQPVIYWSCKPSSQKNTWKFSFLTILIKVKNC